MTHIYQLWAAIRPPTVIGNTKVGFSAKYPWERNWCWASERATAIFGARQRATGR